MNFLANTSNEYYEMEGASEAAKGFAVTVQNLLKTFCESTTHETRECLMLSISKMQKSGVISFLDTIPLWFKIMSSEDKVLRRIVYHMIVRDIQNIWQKHKDLSYHGKIRDLITSHVDPSVTSVQMQRK